MGLIILNKLLNQVLKVTDIIMSLSSHIDLYVMGKTTIIALK